MRPKEHPDWKNLSVTRDASEPLFAELSPELRSMALALAAQPSRGIRLAKFAWALRHAERTADAKLIASIADHFEPNDLIVRRLTDWARRRQAPMWHFGIIADDARNHFYARALAAAVTPDSVVFEIGTGSGLLALLAARAGARHVYTCESQPEVAKAAKDIIEVNGYRDKVTVIPKAAQALVPGLDIPELADIFVAELIDNSILGEGLLPLTELAKRSFLKPDALLIPEVVTVVGAAASAKKMRGNFSVDHVMGFDLTPFNRFKPPEISCASGSGKIELLGPVTDLVRFDLRQSNWSPRTTNTNIYVDRECEIDGVARWIRLESQGVSVYENPPWIDSCWDPHLCIFQKSVQLQSGQALQILTYHDWDSLYVTMADGA